MTARRGDSAPNCPDWAVTPWIILDHPADGETVPRGLVMLDGWAMLDDGPAARVEVLLNGRPVADARVALPRLDAAEVWGDPAAALAGFGSVLDLAPLGARGDEVTVTVRVHAMSGAVATGPELRLRLGPPAPAPISDDERARAAALRRRALAIGVGAGRRERDGVRLLVVTHDLTLGGAQLYLHELLRHLAGVAGVDCHVLAISDGPLRERLEELGIPVHITGPVHQESVEFYEARVAELTAWASSHGINAVLTNTVGLFVGADVAGCLGVPSLWAIHESWPLQEYWRAAYVPGMQHPHVRQRAESALARADVVTFVADATRELYSPHLAPGSARTLRYGVDIDAIDAQRVPLAIARRQLGLDPARRLVVCLATVEPRKGQAVLAQAFAHLRGRHPDVDLAIVGIRGQPYEDAVYEDALRHMVTGTRLSGRVLLVDMTSDAATWHAAADLLVCASDIESMPRSVLEAMAFETPVLATEVFGIPEVIEHGRTGFLCRPRDVAALTRALDEVLGLPAERLDEVAAAARLLVAERHDVHGYVTEWERLIRGSVRAWAGDGPTTRGDDGPQLEPSARDPGALTA